MPSALAIAQVSPFPWEDRHEVNDYIRHSAAELAALGHQVVIVAPSRDQTLIRRSRRALSSGELFGKPGAAPVVLAVGEALPLPGAATRGRAALPIDVARNVETLLARAELDIVHVHEPYAPSVASAALRNSRALNVGTFHAPAERLLATQFARRLVELVFGRLDARHAAYATTRDLVARFFPADYRVVLPGATPRSTAVREDGPLRLLFADVEERAALRLFLRALRRLPSELGWEATVISARGPSSTTPLRAELRSRVEFSGEGLDAALKRADIVIAASDGAVPAPGMVSRALGAGAIPVTARLPIYSELTQDGGLEFEPGDAEALAAQLARLIGDERLREGLRASAPASRSWAEVAAELDGCYRELVARRRDPRGRPDIWKRISRRRVIDVDLHMHTDHSHDCATPVEHLLATARDQGLGAIAITDHNEISGAFEAAAKAADFGVKVIVGEEVKTASQGEVIGLFLQEKIPRGMTLRETVDAIRAQGGLVYVPHPFDRMHSVPDYEHLLTVLDDVDAIEVYNPRVAIGSFNEEAERFAAKYRLPRGAGSDSHVAQGLGSVRVRMRDFGSAEEFLESLRHAEIVTKPGTLLYVQALKFLETRATPPAARRARRERRVRKATRKP